MGVGWGGCTDGPPVGAEDPGEALATAARLLSGDQVGDFCLRWNSGARALALFSPKTTILSPQTPSPALAWRVYDNSASGGRGRNAPRQPMSPDTPQRWLQTMG